MDGFNLLPEEFQRRHGARFAPISILVTLGVALLGVLLMELAVIGRAGSGSGSLLVDTLADRRADLARTRQERLALEGEIEPLDAVLSRAPVWSNILIDVAAVIEPGIRITRWSADAKRGLCSIEGRAGTNGEVFTLVAALEGLAHFKSVTLAGVAKETEDDEDGRGVRYEIVCRLRWATR